MEISRRSLSKRKRRKRSQAAEVLKERNVKLNYREKHAALARVSKTVSLACSLSQKKATELAPHMPRLGLSLLLLQLLQRNREERVEVWFPRESKTSMTLEKRKGRVRLNASSST